MEETKEEMNARLSLFLDKLEGECGGMNVQEKIAYLKKRNEDKQLKPYEKCIDDLRAALGLSMDTVDQYIERIADLEKRLAVKDEKISELLTKLDDRITRHDQCLDKLISSDEQIAGFETEVAILREYIKEGIIEENKP